jgi:hypothetical protein
VDGPRVRRRSGHRLSLWPHIQERRLFIRPIGVRGAHSFSALHTRTDVCVCAMVRYPPSASRSSTCVLTSPSYSFCRAGGSRRVPTLSNVTACPCPTRSGSLPSTAGRIAQTSGLTCLRLLSGCCPVNPPHLSNPTFLTLVRHPLPPYSTLANDVSLASRALCIDVVHSATFRV